MSEQRSWAKISPLSRSRIGSAPRDCDDTIAEHEGVQLHRRASPGGARSRETAEEGLRSGGFISIDGRAVGRPLALLLEKCIEHA